MPEEFGEGLRDIERNLCGLYFFDGAVDLSRYDGTFPRRVARACAAGTKLSGGNGVLLSKDGRVLTAGHVADNFYNQFSAVEYTSRGVKVSDFLDKMKKRLLVVTENSSYPLRYVCSDPLDNQAGTAQILEQNKDIEFLNCSVYISRDYKSGSDLGILRCDLPNEDISLARIKFSEKKPQSGDEVFVVGFDTPNISKGYAEAGLFRKKGIVSAVDCRHPSSTVGLGDSETQFNFFNAFTIDTGAFLGPGHSGSIVAKENGEIVGIVIAGSNGNPETEAIEGAVCIDAYSILKFLREAENR